MQLQEPYAARSIRFLELWKCGDWRIKVYGLAYRRPAPEPGLVEAAKHTAAGCLPRPAVTAHHHGVGFLGVHQGRGANLVFIDWWANENELYHHACLSTPDSPDQLEPVGPAGLAGCTWDLAVIAFEREAWVSAVLSAASPDVERYLALRFEGMV